MRQDRGFPLRFTSTPVVLLCFCVHSFKLREREGTDNGFLCEKEEIQVPDPSDPGGADRRAFCQRGFVLQTAASGRRFCGHFFQVKTKAFKNFL